MSCQYLHSCFLISPSYFIFCLLHLCMLSFCLESFIFSPFKVRTYRTVPSSHTGFCGYFKFDQSYCGKIVDWMHLAMDCWWKCPYIIKSFLLWNVQNYVGVEVSVFLWCGNLSVSEWCLMFWGTVIVSSLREEKALDGCFDPWRWDHYTVSKH